MSYSTEAFWLRLLFRTRRVGCRYHSPACLRIPLKVTPMVARGGRRADHSGLGLIVFTPVFIKLKNAHLFSLTPGLSPVKWEKRESLTALAVSPGGRGNS